MIIDIEFLRSKYFWEIDMPWLVWQDIKMHTIWAIQAAKEHDHSNMLDHIIAAEHTISLYNAALWYHIDEERDNEEITAQSLRLTGYNHISELIEHIYNRYCPF